MANEKIDPYSYVDNEDGFRELSEDDKCYVLFTLFGTPRDEALVEINGSCSQEEF